MTAPSTHIADRTADEPGGFVAMMIGWALMSFVGSVVVTVGLYLPLRTSVRRRPTRSARAVPVAWARRSMPGIPLAVCGKIGRQVPPTAL